MVLRIFACVAALLLLVPLNAIAGGPAVSGPNGKLSLEGGRYDDENSFLALGSYTVPLGTTLGFQADGAVGTIDDKVIGGGGAHLFTRDPSSYLLGVYGSYHTWDSIDIWRAAAEAELLPRALLVDGARRLRGHRIALTTKGGLAVLNADDDHFFGRADLSYYLTDDFKISGGYRYVSEASLGSASAEYLLRDTGVPVSIFAKGDWGEEQYNRITGGLKIYFGADPGQDTDQAPPHRGPDKLHAGLPEIDDGEPAQQVNASPGR